MQRCGLKYFKDFQQRVPRDEAAVVERIVREAMLDLLDCRKAPDADLLHVRVVGRFAVPLIGQGLCWQKTSIRKQHQQPSSTPLRQCGTWCDCSTVQRSIIPRKNQANRCEVYL